MSKDRVTDVLSRIQKDWKSDGSTAFARRVKNAADALYSSNISDPALRIRLWVRIASALGLDTTLPLSTRRANSAGAAVASKSAAVMANPVSDDEEEIPATMVHKAWNTVRKQLRRHLPATMCVRLIKFCSMLE
ncbi:hypothetical protein ELH81_15680 [Rhizobium leguminosarum]|uniref:hypothetical protein n=1 Tax=Rhizobium leguminosarum TaxID=384 RepID=UPI0010315B60|nr:hypothetical protein [Rhizobium leguminosarum]TAZ15412.1 hypothetical protein ELH81_15680 [Rhizobium leguminosarum]